MKKAFVLMTAMPPTTGHLQLVQFANRLADKVTVLLCTQPFEPMPTERVAAFREAIYNNRMDGVTLKHYAKAIPQDPKTEGFWEMWQTILHDHGLRPGDYIVASEKYGQKLAELTDTEFFPYDLGRDLNPAKATPVRDDPAEHFSDIIPEFRKYLTTRVTIFGAESTGKTTLSRQLAEKLNTHWIFEYARPYLENTINEITIRSMEGIWKGQRALQTQQSELATKPCIVQDTDLFSTVGYWQFPHWQQTLGSCPSALIDDAQRLQSDLYIVTRSNIPFEQDPLRYGGDTREGSDEYWIQVCERYHLPYIVLESSDSHERLETAFNAVQHCMQQKFSMLSYDRHGL